MEDQFAKDTRIIKDLMAENAELLQRNIELRDENKHLSYQIGFKQTIINEHATTISELLSQKKQLEALIFEDAYKMRAYDGL